MPKSQIIIDAVNGDVPIDKSLKRLQVLAHDVYNKELEKWAENELTGYLDSSEVPEYRETKSLNIVYSGFNLALQVNNVPLPIGYLDNDTLNEVVNVAIREDILSVQKFADTEPGGYRDLSFLAGEVLKKSGGIQCVSIQQLVPSSAYGKILAEVNNRIIRALMMLEDQHGKLEGSAGQRNHQRKPWIACTNRQEGVLDLQGCMEYCHPHHHRRCRHCSRCIGNHPHGTWLKNASFTSFVFGDMNT